MKTISHKKVTKLSIELCEKELNEEILKYREEIIQGSKDEDTTELISRAFHWHFYRQKNSSIPKQVKMIFNPTSEIIFKKRVSQFKSEKSLKKNIIY